MRCLFAHGFEGMPTGRKPRFLRSLGHTVDAPLMSTLGWALADHVALLHARIDADPELQLLVGSSLGALAMAVAASQRPARDLRLVLIAPAVGVHTAWAERLGADAMAGWSRDGVLQYHHQGLDQSVTLPFALHTQCAAAAAVVCTHPTAIVHGLQDEVIPVENAFALAARSPGVRRFTAVADNHRLLNALPEIEHGIHAVMRDPT